MSPRIITFSNLFPSAQRPTHGGFVLDRMRRVVERTGFDWEVVSPVPRVPRLLRRQSDRRFESMPERELFDGVTVHHPRYFHVPGLSERAQAQRMTKASRPLLTELCATGPVVLDAHYLYPDGVAALTIAGELGLPCFVTARGSDLNVLAEKPSLRQQIERSAAGARRRFAVSEPLRQRFEALGAGSVELARNGVDLTRFRPGDEDAARARLGLPQGLPLVAAVGRLTPGKGFHQMARALRDLPESVHFAVAGDGPEAPRLRALAPEGRLHLLGTLDGDDLVRLYQAADLLVLPSEREGWPNVVTEALACGLPVVATPVGAVPEMLAVPYAGSLVRVGDARALAAEVRRHLAQPRDPARVREYAERFSWEQPVALLAEAFREAVA